MGDTWNITKILIETFKKESNMTYTQVYNILECSDQIASHWRNKGKVPSRTSIAKIRDGILEYFENKDIEKINYMTAIKRQFNQAGDRVVDSINGCSSLSELLDYLYYSFEDELYNDKLQLLINEPSNISFLRKIILKKFKLFEEDFPNFQVEEFWEKDKEIWENDDISWKLNLNHCFIVKIHTYKVLINFNFNIDDYKLAGEYEETENITKEYNVDMILLYSNVVMPDKEVRTLMKYNIYVELIDSKEVNEQKISKTYIYEPKEKDLEMVELANKYTDTIIQRFDKYFSIVFKNVLFSEKRMKSLRVKQQDNFVLWEAKYATRHHINFQTKRIEELVCGKQMECALAIGYLSFPSLLRLKNNFNKIYLMENSSQAINRYNKWLEENEPELKNKIKYISFSSVLFECITEKHNLYQKFDFILLGSGNASLIKKMQLYYRICNLWLKENGVMYVSFLNSEFLYGYIDRITEVQNFEIIPKLDKKSAVAMIVNSSERYNLYCNACTNYEMHSLAEKYFKVIKKYSYPLACVIEGSHENYVQNILKELDKEYSRHGFLQPTYKNCRGYYLDIVLKKSFTSTVEMFVPKRIENIKFDNKEGYKEYYLKTLLLTERSSAVSQVYVFLLPSKKMLPETSNNEICIANKRCRLLTIAEINNLGIEYKNISPFLKSNDAKVRLIKMYDSEIEKEQQKFYYVGAGNSSEGYKIRKDVLLEELAKAEYTAQKI